MAAGISYYHNGTIGRMFARQNVPNVYGKQKTAPPPEQQEENQAVDTVSLSPHAPRPLTGSFIREAFAAADAIASGEPIPEENSTRLREDRVFAAVSALALMGYDEGEAAVWPGGIPAPSRAELQAARRRLAQRPQEAEETAAAGSTAMRARRLEVLEKTAGNALEETAKTRNNAGGNASR